MKEAILKSIALIAVLIIMYFYLASIPLFKLYAGFLYILIGAAIFYTINVLSKLLQYYMPYHISHKSGSAKNILIDKNGLLNLIQIAKVRKGTNVVDMQDICALLSELNNIMLNNSDQNAIDFLLASLSKTGIIYYQEKKIVTKEGSIKDIMDDHLRNFELMNGYSLKKPSKKMNGFINDNLFKDLGASYTDKDKLILFAKDKLNYYGLLNKMLSCEKSSSLLLFLYANNMVDINYATNY